ncbi:MAG TPA: SGNH/GDSL hydrolase family protein [Thermoanaerobaculia bacterium]|nr:SGNH/GDSL hydrolase family protein [Thermoanaerobaculia bacterium]
MIGVRFLALGDSYTAGEGLSPGQSWPDQLAGRLEGLGKPLAELRVIAKTGWTTEELEEAIDRAELLPAWDRVSLLIGVNDQYRGVPSEEFGGRFERVLEKAIALAGGRSIRTLVLSIPDWGVTPFAADRNGEEIAAAIDLFNGIIESRAAARGCRYLDVTDSSRKAASDPKLIAPDGLHLSEACYAIWIETIVAELE